MNGGFEPSMFDKLFDNALDSLSASSVRKLSLEEYKDTISRDLEMLLNTRAMYDAEDLKKFPECSRSILTYGLKDFSHLSIASHLDRQTICDSIRNAIALHEPRLKDINVKFEMKGQSKTDLYFGITAKLKIDAGQDEAVNFDALLQPTTLQYSVSKKTCSARR